MTLNAPPLARPAPVRMLTGVLLGGLLLAGLLPAIVAPAMADGRIRTGTDPVRNTSPERSAVPTDEEWPLYHPRQGRSDDTLTGPTATLLTRFVALHSALRYEDALPVARELVVVAPDRPLVHYNHACVLARLRRPDEAFAALDSAVDCGWRNLTHTRIDPDLATLRHDERFRNVLVKMFALIDAERVVPGPLRSEPWPDVVEDLRDTVPALLARYHVPGAAVALVRDGRCVWTGGFGQTRDPGGRAVGPHTVFPRAAPETLLAIMAAAQLQADGVFDLQTFLAEAAPAPDRGERSASLGRVEPARRTVPVARREPPAFGWGSPRREAAEWRLARWPMTDPSVDRLDDLRAAVASASRLEFEQYCCQRILGPIGLGCADVPDGEDGACSPGHGRLGGVYELPQTDMPAVAGVASARDLGRLLEVVLENPDRLPTAPPARPRGPARRTAGLHHAGIPLFRDETPYGERIQVAELVGGTGCLVRWYPEQGCGVVVLFNSETGPEAAVRIASEALGGL